MTIPILLAVLVKLAVGGHDVSVRYISNLPKSPPSIDVFLVAHQDDWQLFMGDVVVDRLKGGSSGIFIYLTAGDDGRDSLYWQTRERAALQSTRLAAGVPASGSAEAMCALVNVVSHSIRRCTVGHTQSYFLRLPDGSRNGGGFSAHDYQSLRKLRSKRISALTALDGSTIYHGWGDLAATVLALVARDSAASVTLHANDPSVVVNPHDHYDHRMAGVLAAELRQDAGWRAVYYLGYALATRNDNRTRAQADVKKALFLLYDQEMMFVNQRWSTYGEHPKFYSECMLRTYSRNPPVR